MNISETEKQQKHQFTQFQTIFPLINMEAQKDFLPRRSERFERRSEWIMTSDNTAGNEDITRNSEGALGKIK